MMRLSERCPCNSGREYRQCCSPFVKGQRPLQNAELLLRARFCAKILNLTKFLMDTWHSSTRPKKIEELPFDLRGFKIISSERKKECDYISFSIYLRIDGTINEFTVRSQFKQESENWFFLNEEILKAEPIEDTSKPLPSEILKLYKMAEAGKNEPSKINRDDFENVVDNSKNYLKKMYEDFFGSFKEKTDEEICENVFKDRYLGSSQLKIYYMNAFQGILNALNRNYLHISNALESEVENPNSLESNFRFFWDIVFDLIEFLNELEDCYNDDFSYYGFKKNKKANSVKIFHLAEYHLRHCYSKHSFSDFIRQPIATFLIRQAIELRVKNALGINAIFYDFNFLKITPDKFIDFITNHKEIIFPIKKSILKKIHNWTNHYIHGGIMPEVWKMDLAYQLLKPLFHGDRSIYGSIKIDRDYYKFKIENDIKKYLCEKDSALKVEKIFIYKTPTPEALLVKV